MPVDRVQGAGATRTTEKAGIVYRQHREWQRRRILDAARRLFDGRGFDRTTMGDVMAESGLRAATLVRVLLEQG